MGGACNHLSIKSKSNLAVFSHVTCLLEAGNLAFARVAKMECLRTNFVVLGFVLCMIFVAGSEVIRVDGDDFVAFNLSSVPWLRKIKTHTLSLEFKTVHPNNLLVYIGSERQMNDFVMVDLVRGKLRITVNLGDDTPTTRHHLVLEDKLAINEWQTVKLQLFRRRLNVTLDGQKYYLLLPSKYAYLDIHDGFVFAGGIPRHTSDILQGFEPSSNLKGCLRNVYFDKKAILPRGAQADGNRRVYGSPENNCRHVEFETLSFQHEDTSIHLMSRSKNSHLNVQMRFRTYIDNGVLAVKGDYPSQFVGVFLVGGKLFLESRWSTGPSQHAISIRLGKNLNDGEWHYFSAVVKGTRMKLIVDQQERMRSNLFLNSFRRFSIIYIGFPSGSLGPIPNFFGCIHDLHVDGKVVNLRNTHSDVGTLHNRCNISSQCFPNPCMHCGRCNETRSGTFSCNCLRTFYRGPLCERPVLQRSCQKYMNLGLAEDAYCKVKPNAEGPRRVLCSMTDENQAVMAINHNKVGPKKVSTSAAKIPVNMIQFTRSERHSYHNVGPSECFTTDTRNRELTHEMELEASRYLYSMCQVVNPTTEPRPSTLMTDYTEQETEPTTERHPSTPMTDYNEQEFEPTTEPRPSTPMTDYIEQGTEPTTEPRPSTLKTDYSEQETEPTTEPRPSTKITDYTEQETEPTTWRGTMPLMTTKPVTPVAMTTKGSTAKGVVDEVSTSQLTPTNTKTSSAHTFDEATQAVATDNSASDFPTTPALNLPTSKAPAIRPSPVSSPSVMRSATPSNSTQALGDLSIGLTPFDQEASTGEEKNQTALSWQLGLAWALLTILFLMFVLAVGYIINKRRGCVGCHGCLLGVQRKKKKEKTLAELYGFPEARRRPRSGKMGLSDARSSIEAGSPKSGTIAYGESFYM